VSELCICVCVCVSVVRRGSGWMDGWMYTEHFETSSGIHTLNTRSKYHNRLTANLSYFQKSA